MKSPVLSCRQNSMQAKTNSPETKISAFHSKLGISAWSCVASRAIYPSLCKQLDCIPSPVRVERYCCLTYHILHGSSSSCGSSCIDIRVWKVARVHSQLRSYLGGHLGVLPSKLACEVGPQVPLTLLEQHGLGGCLLLCKSRLISRLAINF